MERWIPVYSRGQDRRKQAMYSIPPAKALELETDGCAEFNKKRTVLIMKRLESEMYRPAPSLKPNVRTMDAFVEGKPYAVAIINSWAFAA